MGENTKFSSERRAFKLLEWIFNRAMLAFGLLGMIFAPAFLLFSFVAILPEPLSPAQKLVTLLAFASISVALFCGAATHWISARGYRQPTMRRLRRAVLWSCVVVVASVSLLVFSWGCCD